MDVLMASGTASWGSRVVDSAHIALRACAWVALGASHFFVGAFQGESSGGVIEARQFLPGNGVVAALTAGGIPIRHPDGHSRSKLTFVRVIMASGALPGS